MAFDPHDKEKWYFGPLTRQQTEDMLNMEDEVGVFLVRNSSSIQGDLVLCVREDNRVSHYIINKVQQPDNQVRFRIGDQSFRDVPTLLEHYKTVFLDTTTLKRPIQKLDALEKYIAKFDFQGRDPEDLPFKRRDVLYILCKDEEQWWTARNIEGKHGIIPVPYVEPAPSCTQNGHLEGNANLSEHRSSTPPSISLRNEPRGGLNCSSPSAVPSNNNSNGHFKEEVTPSSQTNLERMLPAKARVIQSRIPSPYDKAALRLLVGDIITVTKTNPNGQWEGELNGKVGHFPFTHVAFIEEN